MHTSDHPYLKAQHMRRGFRMVFWGWVLVTLEVSLQLQGGPHPRQLDILSDAVGWLLAAYGIGFLADAHPSYPWLRLLAFALAGFCFVSDDLLLLFPEPAANTAMHTIATVWDLLVSLMTLVFMTWLSLVVRAQALTRKDRDLAARALLSACWFPTLGVIFGLIALVCGTEALRVQQADLPILLVALLILLLSLALPLFMLHGAGQRLAGGLRAAMS